MAGIRDRIASVAAVAPRAYWVLWWGTLINRLGNFVVPMLTIYLIRVRHVSVSEAGAAVAMYGAGSIGASFIGGYLADHVGRKPTLAIALFGGSAAMLGLGLARDLTTITVMVGVLALVTEQYRPAVQAIVADVVPRPQQIAAYGLLHWVINIGFSFAAIIGGLLAELDFTILFIADAATTLIYGVIVLIAVPETRPARTPQHRASPSRSWITDPSFVAFILILFGLALLPVQAAAPLAAHMTEQGFPAAAFGGVIAVNGVLIIILQPTLAGWASRRDATRVLIAAALFYGVGLAMHGLATSLVLHAAAVMVWTVGEILESPTRASIVAAMSPIDARGRYQGAVVMTFGAAQLIGPRAGTWIWQHVGRGVLWAGCLALSVVIVIALAATAPGRRRRMAR
ncbi:MAG TPA: MFS transporter [Kofleriaceae bacterium]|nr:MFS transporter [Kofleriaceae bacterium]